jgi:hypothetical protein
MELSNRGELSNEILDDEKLRYCEIYKITNLENNKIYIGQAVSHILNHKRYRPYGGEGRLRCHISEAYSNKKNQCHYLNSAIKKYGCCNFDLDIIDYCELDKADELEDKYITKYDSIYPNGYNLKIGGKTFRHCDESKKRLSAGVMKYYKEKKFHKFMLLKSIDSDYEKYIKPLNRENIQYGWYVYINENGTKYKADFGGSHISLDDSKKMTLEFLKELAKRLDAGIPLEPTTTTL